MLHKVGQEDNTSYYNQGSGKADFILNVVWHWSFDKTMQRILSSNELAETVEGYNEEDDDKKTVTIQDCFSEFEKTEILDQDNMWYCKKCKEHKQAQKKFQLYRVPPVFVVSLKRFKQSKRSYGGFLGGGGFG
jgi:hypothetical protein